MVSSRDPTRPRGRPSEPRTKAIVPDAGPPNRKPGAAASGATMMSKGRPLPAGVARRERSASLIATRLRRGVPIGRDGIGSTPQLRLRLRSQLARDDRVQQGTEDDQDDERAHRAQRHQPPPGPREQARLMLRDALGRPAAGHGAARSR